MHASLSKISAAKGLSGPFWLPIHLLNTFPESLFYMYLHSCRTKCGDAACLACLCVSVSFLARRRAWTSYKRNGLLYVSEQANSRARFHSWEGTETHGVCCAGVRRIKTNREKHRISVYWHLAIHRCVWCRRHRKCDEWGLSVRPQRLPRCTHGPRDQYSLMEVEVLWWGTQTANSLHEQSSKVWKRKLK